MRSRYTKACRGISERSLSNNSHLNVLDDSKRLFARPHRSEKPLVILMSMAGLLVAMCASTWPRCCSCALRPAPARCQCVTPSAQNASALPRSCWWKAACSELPARLPFAACAFGGSRAGSSYYRSDPGEEPYSATIDARILLFTLAVAVLVSLLFSIAPVLHFPAAQSRRHAAPELRHGHKRLAALSQDRPSACRLRSA